MDENIHVKHGRGGDRDDALRVKYHCQYINRKNMELVIKLTASDDLQSSSTVVQRYVILMDISGSMDVNLDGDDRSLLDRMKVFCSLFVDEIPVDSCLAIVTFSDNAIEEFPMTTMNGSAKNEAKQKIQSLATDGATNISEGLFESLNTILRSASPQANRDCIILFTDGQANDGIIDAKELAKQFKERVKNSSRPYGITVAGFTIGDNQPEFMTKIALELGSEPFYWLDPKKKFESKMLYPMLWRKRHVVSDITLEMKCQNGTKFIETDQLELQPSLKETQGDIRQVHFIHFIPAGKEKNINISLKIPHDKNLDGKVILQVWKSFRDQNLTKQDGKDSIELRLKSMKEALYESSKVPRSQIDALVSSIASLYMQNAYSYSKEKNKTDNSWNAAQESMATVAFEKIRLKVASAFETSASLIAGGHTDAVKEACENVSESIEEAKKLTLEVLGENSPYNKALLHALEQNIEPTLRNVRENPQDYNHGRMISETTSFLNEMPNADEKKNFVSTTFKKELKHVKENLRRNTHDEDMPSEDDESETSSSATEDLEEQPESPKSQDLVPAMEDDIESQPPVEEQVQNQPNDGVIRIFNPNSNTQEDYDPDFLFMTSLLPDFKQLSRRAKFDVKRKFFDILGTALFESSLQDSFAL